MKATKKTRMYDRIARHGENLKAVFGLPKDTDAVKLCKQLRKLEIHANRIMTQYCNGEITFEQVDEEEIRIYTIFNTTLFKYGVEGKDRLIFINRDPRGYTLKFTEEATKTAQDNGINIHRDWGGYGIIAPEFDGKE